MANNKLDGFIPYSTKRYIGYLVVTITALSLPFITINDKHFFLLNFDNKQLHLFFNTFDMQELYLMPFLLIMMFLSIFMMTVLGGRVFCGWLCPQTIFRVIYRDLIQTKLLGLHRNSKNKQKIIDYNSFENQIKGLFGFFLWSALAVTAAADFTWYFIPPDTFFEYMYNPLEHTTLLGFFIGISLFLIADIVLIKENFCAYICPYSRVQSVLYDEDTIMAIYDKHRGGAIYNEYKSKEVFSRKDLTENDECTTCEQCVAICPTHIDIRKGVQLECINCLECVDACTVVMGKQNKDSLIQWSSVREVINRTGETRYFRGKIIGYISIIILMMILLIKLGSEKEHMLLNINKETRLYSIETLDSEDKKRVKNGYVFLFQNTDTKDHEYYFEIENENIEILRPKKPFKLKAGRKAKKVVVLFTDEVLAENDRKDVTIPLKITAYATDDRDLIEIERKAIFVYPRLDVLEEANEDADADDF